MSFLLLAGLVPLLGTLLIRWWFGLRVLALVGPRPCVCDLGRWLPAPGDPAQVHRAEGTAAEFGRQLWHKAMNEWREHSPREAASREGTRRFGLAVPPLSAVVAVFAVLVGKIPPTGAIAACLLVTALAAVLGLLTLPPELKALARTAAKVRKERGFPKSDDEEAVIRCAIAHAWDAALPPVVRWIQR